MLHSFALVAFGSKGYGSGKGHSATSFRSIEHFITPEQDHARRFGAIPADQATVVVGKQAWNATANANIDRAGNWHGQAEQDQNVFAVLNGLQGGFFVDLAANEPITFSNTRALERDHGWTGLCIDGNQKMLEKLARQRVCRVFQGVVSSESGKEVSFTAPLKEGSWEDAMGGILSEKTDNRQRRPEYAKRQWHIEKHTTVTLKQVLDHAHAPSTIDYISLDIEGAEYEAMRTFDFGAYRFRVLTIERPVRALRELLRNNSYVYLKTNQACFGDQLWVHTTLAVEARARLAIPPKSDSYDMNECCLPTQQGYVRGATIDNGCCGFVGNQATCVAKVAAAGR